MTPGRATEWLNVTRLTFERFAPACIEGAMKATARTATNAVRTILRLSIELASFTGSNEGVTRVEHFAGCDGETVRRCEGACDGAECDGAEVRTCDGAKE